MSPSRALGLVLFLMTPVASAGETAEPPPIFRGRVVDEEHRPIPGFTVTDRPGHASGFPYSYGEFQIAGRGGTNLFYVKAPGMGRRLVIAEGALGATVDLGDIVLSPARDIEARVSDAETGLPLGRARIAQFVERPELLWRWSSRDIDPTTEDRGLTHTKADASGWFRLTGLGDDAELVISASGYLSRRVRVKELGTEVKLQRDLSPPPRQWMTISGRVLGRNGKPLRGCVEFDHEQGFFDSTPGPWRLLTQSDGTFQLDMEAIGEGAITFRACTTVDGPEIIEQRFVVHGDTTVELHGR